VPLPAVVTVLEGGVEPRYPTITGRMKAKKVEDRDRGAAAGAARLRPGAAHAAARAAEHGRGARRGPDAAAAVVDLLRALGVAR
jgi:electron transfer flavoprotein beta subunit